MRKISLSPAQIVLLVGLHVIFETGSVIAQSNEPISPTLGRIVLIEPKEPKGNLRVRQARRLPPVNAFEGMLVHRGYVLILNSTARAVVMCGDGKKRELKPGAHGCPCTQPCTPEVCGIRYDGSTISATRGPDTQKGEFPVVISPRKTMLRNLRPTIRWAPVAGAKESTTYNVTLYGNNMKPLWAQDVVSATKLIYPNNEPPLLPRQIYKVVVTSEGASSQQEHSPALGFTTFTIEQAQMLAVEEANRKELELPETQTRFLVANLYAARELYSEAIEQLEELYKTAKEPEVVRTLGDLFAAIGLNREAEKKYLEALAMTSAGDFDGLGLIRKNLAQVYENLGIFEQAIVQLREAMKAYRWLGNRAMVRFLLNQIQRVKKPGGSR
jgi:hypothetical protein